MQGRGKAAFFTGTNLMQYIITVDMQPDEFYLFGKRGSRRQYVARGDRLVIVSCKNNIRLDHLSVSTPVLAIVGNDQGYHVAVPDNHVGQLHTKITIVELIGNHQYDNLARRNLSQIVARAPIGRDNSSEEIAAGLWARKKQAERYAGDGARD